MFTGESPFKRIGNRRGQICSIIDREAMWRLVQFPDGERAYVQKHELAPLAASPETPK